VMKRTRKLDPQRPRHPTEARARRPTRADAVTQTSRTRAQTVANALMQDLTPFSFTSTGSRSNGAVSHTDVRLPS
jgi:hypothetical protein